MIGCELSIHVSGVGLIKGVLTKNTKDFMFIKGEDNKITQVVKKWITMFRVIDKNPKPVVNVYGIKKIDGKDTNIRFFRVGEKKEGDEKAFLNAVSVSGTVFYVGEINELSMEELQKSLDGTITGDES